MRCVIQRVKRASVNVQDEIVGQISAGLLVLLAVRRGDGVDDLTWMVDKLVGLRIFEDDEQKMNRSVLDVGGEILVVSQFTLYGDCRKGKRPSFSSAAPPEQAKEMFDRSVEAIRSYGLKVETGVFQAEMDVEMINAGPVTILLDSEKKF